VVLEYQKVENRWCSRLIFSS